MNAHPPEPQLHDYLDGLLGEAERREVEEHLESCDACRAEIAALRDLTARLAALPRTVAPERDLRPGIHARIRWGSASVSASSETGRRLAVPSQDADSRSFGSRLDAPRPLRQRYALAAAAVLLAALGAVLALVVTRDLAPPPVASEESTPQPAAAELHALDARYTAAAGELLAELEALEAALPPGTLAIVRENLRAIDRALDEARLATASDPGDPRLARLILAAHEKKLDLLRRAAALPVES